MELLSKIEAESHEKIAREPWELSFEDFTNEYQSLMHAVAKKEQKAIPHPFREYGKRARRMVG